MKQLNENNFESNYWDDLLYKAALEKLSGGERETLKTKLLADSIFREKFCDFLKAFSKFKNQFHLDA